MEAQYKTRDGRLVIKVEAEHQKGLFKELAAAQEVFESEAECGCCRSKELRFRVRIVDENEFYELACNCGARFEFGQHKKGGSLFRNAGRRTEPHFPIGAGRSGSLQQTRCRLTEGINPHSPLPVETSSSRSAMPGKQEQRAVRPGEFGDGAREYDP